MVTRVSWLWHKGCSSGGSRAQLEPSSSGQLPRRGGWELSFSGQAACCQDGLGRWATSSLGAGPSLS